VTTWGVNGSAAMVYEGQRYRVACALAGKPYGQPFGLDIASRTRTNARTGFGSSRTDLSAKLAGAPQSKLELDVEGRRAVRVDLTRRVV
jgi:hypothetical protein